jgi:single-stranded-DNA-specific exonuclease
MLSNWPWTLPACDAAAVQQLAQDLGVQRLSAACLLQRGVTNAEDARRFLHCDLSELADPFSMKGVKIAAHRLAAAAKSGEPVLICGDYDVDGVTSVALFVLVLQKLGIPVEYYIPSRLGEGYGLQGSELERFAACGGRLAVTVDCGINSFAEMELARSLEMDLIVTDHHECFPGKRDILAVLNPKQPDCGYPERNLAGVGVAWTLVRGLHHILGIPEAEAESYLDLVALGTIGDVVPLLHENRILAKHGLERLNRQPLPGLAALAKISGMAGKPMSATQVAFTLGPRINAPGRLGDAEPAVRLLLGGDAEADVLSLQLDRLNKERQQVEKEILEEARKQAVACGDDPALVLWDKKWHPGVVGIVAGRLASEFERPAALIALDGREGRGSVRSVPGCNVVDALAAASEHLARYGGHKEAAGLTVEIDCLEAFRQAFCQAVAAQGMMETEIPVVAEADPAELTLELFEELSRLEPFGQGNPEPLFIVRSAGVATARKVGKSANHLQLRLQKDGRMLSGIQFGGGEQTLAQGDMVDIVTALAENTWQGRTSLSLHVRDLRQSVQPEGVQILDWRKVGDKDAKLASLAQKQALAVWVNTKAALDGLQETLAGCNAHITQLGRGADNITCEALAFYHIPYDREALERFLAAVTYMGPKRVYLFFGSEDLQLNERIFAASIPREATLRQLAACMEKTAQPLTAAMARGALAFPVTQYLLGRAQAVFAELSAGESIPWAQVAANLEQSATYQTDKMRLAAFRACQRFWWESDGASLGRYLEEPAEMNLPEGETDYESGRVKRAN